MASMAYWLDVFKQTLGILAFILAYPLQLAWSLVYFLISSVVGVLLTVLAPFIYIGSFCLACVQAITNAILSLEPIYVFLSCAAVIGIFAGMFIALTSGVITSALGMQDDGRPSRFGQDDDDDDVSLYYDSSIPPTPLSSTSTARLSSTKSEDSWSFERDLQRLERMQPKSRKRTAGLVAQTIHEETDDSDF